MAYLGLDCSSPYLALALYQNGVLASFCERVGRDHAKRITQALDELFAQANLRPKDLSGITVGVGPGSYTGVRVGVAAAQGIARSLNVPLRGENTLLGMAATVLAATNPRGIVALDARRGNVYAGVFRWQQGRIVQEGELVKTGRAALQEKEPPYFENIAPNAGYLACCAAFGANQVVPLYL